MSGFLIRPAELEDLDALCAIEERVFDTDRLSRRSFRHYITKARDALLVAVDEDNNLLGYALVLFRSGTALARLYSIAVQPDRLKSGIGSRLIKAAEDEAEARDCILLRLEVRADNQAAIELYKRRGYKQFGTYLDYYQDHMDALRFEKRLIPHVPDSKNTPPYFEQTLDFTCGPACIMMALAWADPAIRPARILELRLWREATTIYMTSGLGGCEPYGLAVTLARRGLKPELRLSSEGPFFLDSVRSDEKRTVMRLAQEDFRDEAQALDIPIRLEPVGAAGLIAALDEGAIAIVLVSGFRMFAQKVPHWVLAHGHDDRHVFVHDPWIETDDLETRSSAANLPIPISEFDRMARYGKDGLRAAVIIRKGADA
ncbi:N-acetyltransferase GCN5 [Agaricicola taiwanensis]|uniref:N-acetyltransferase GCN5 n=1 Tax=Agaricicola taiwanensis TaxID=591372 RepID=A0A8J3DYF8_9RHOB|nr:GNAT family N-acetyltransferase/peptidase C39 family protein [Agaricicola taiwanensis]GGE53405.1 N-acetyltransferase GCN5 [Agaricicola taiwanensis]